MSMLMVIREYISALPDPPGDEALLRSDLNELKTAIREGLSAEGLG